MKIAMEKCKECGTEIQKINMVNHAKNHELEKKAAAAKKV